VFNKRSAGLVLASLAIVGLLEGALTRAWWTLNDVDQHVRVDMGTTTSRVCIKGNCRVLPHKKVAAIFRPGDNRRLWMMAGAASAWGAYVTAALLFASAFLAWRRRTVPAVLAAQVTAVLCALLLIWAALYVLLFPGGIEASVRMGHSPVTYFLGTLCGLVGSVLLAIAAERASTPSLDEVFD